MIAWASQIQGDVELGPNLTIAMSSTDARHFPGHQCFRAVDGDLWFAFARCIIARGPHSIKVTWTKGHAFEKVGYLQQHPELHEQADIVDLERVLDIAVPFYLSAPVS